MVAGCGDSHNYTGASSSNNPGSASIAAPGAPANVTATGGNASGMVAWTAPSSNGGGTITAYTATSSPSNLTCMTGGTTSCTVTGLTDGTAYTFSVTASNSAGTGPPSGPSNSVTPGIFAVSEPPKDVSVTPGNGQVTLNWIAPTNSGSGTVSSYTVTYGPTSGVAFTTAGCQTTGTSCAVTGLTNGVAYRFALSTTTTLGGSFETGPASFSNSVTPTSGLVVTPATLALSGLGSGAGRWMTITNTSATAIVINSVSSPSPALPGSASVFQSPSGDCSQVSSLAPNQVCTIAIHTGAAPTSSSGCTSGTVPTPSVITITGNNGAVTVNANVVILGDGCQYQGGYLFAIDDTTPISGSIGGKVVTAADQAAAFPNGVDWSPGGAFDGIWGSDDASQAAQPDPNASSGQPGTLTTGQMNCDGSNDGFCNTNNMVAFYGPGTSYAAGVCGQPIDDTGAVCSGGANCYTDWYLPSVCETGPFGSTGVDSGTYPSEAVSQACNATTNIQNQLVSTAILSNLNGFYWTSTEWSSSPVDTSWVQDFASSGGNQSAPGKNNPPGARCVRTLN